MDTFEAIGLAEGWIECDNEQKIISAWQQLIDTGTCWKLQGWFGRQARYLIEEGICFLPEPEQTTNKTNNL